MNRWSQVGTNRSLREEEKVLQIGPVRIGEEELRWMRWSKRGMTISIRWSWREIPVLLDLSGRVQLRWEHPNDQQCGYPFDMIEGTAQADREGATNGRCNVQLRLHGCPSETDMDSSTP